MSKLLFVSALCLSLTLSGGMAAQAPVELKVGDRAPEFALQGTDGRVHRLSDYQGRAVVLAWFPKAATRGCTIECKSLTASAAAIGAYNVAYFMASVDTAEDNAMFAKNNEANFPLLSDTQKNVARAYGVLNPGGVANRWTFYIGADGRIMHIDRAVNPASSGEDLVSQLTTLQIARK
jgi:thioredoxin-dependent peroxiredoxin